jgi:hypothetical protein
MLDIPSLTDATLTEPIECILCHLSEMDDLNQCALCLENICASCPMNACSCPSEYGVATQLKTELRTKAIELGKLKAIGRQAITTDSQQERMNALNAIINNLSYELMSYDK